MHYVYVIKSIKDGELYVGHTNDLKGRIEERNKGMVKSTRGRRPFKLIYYEASNILQDAVKREKSLKTGFGRAYLNRQLDDI
ncbi:MAG: excinuclease ABC subunit C [Candidatus Portnoybacteria bacterium CG_4_9_14_3_um_filter_44_9]|uniref:Excinuclease ABC subunit C n=1 Tax=Candidatus Portnoybacteria bacterium CG_4_9_14_3_um_filter_44_9 TaxID=1974806 RepID=A0A2M7YKU3_9BACT|nr:MAG: excinuclease ABC subunit C [Candidatus Portnoybacteria bacterium CG_4_9_14_3_um_filter_44_9]